MTVFLDAAVRIGRAICRSAYWDQDQLRCNWVGRMPVGPELTSGALAPKVSALGPGLYGGTSGVALFLAELFARTGDSVFRRTTIGATLRAVRHFQRSPGEAGGSSPLSFFNGTLGVAYVACRVAALTGEDWLSQSAQTLLKTVSAARLSPHPLDFMGGNAGAIPALLALDRACIWEGCRELTLTLAEELCRTATIRGDFAVWDPRHTNGIVVASAPLTGLAHGAAGIGLSLLESYAAMGHPEFLEVGRLAFAYEDSLFNPDLGNWPDYRYRSGTVVSSERVAYGVAWCHGAPGIALSRLQAMRLDTARRHDLAATARAGLRTTLSTAKELSQLGCNDVTLCHGILGLNDILVTAGVLLKDEFYLDNARLIALGLFEKYSDNENWPTGAGGPDPSLMLGIAGIGYHLLRLDAPSQVPTILALSDADGEGRTKAAGL